MFDTIRCWAMDPSRRYLALAATGVTLAAIGMAGYLAIQSDVNFSVAALTSSIENAVYPEAE